MKNLRIVNILASFSRKELSEFREFVHSPYFNKNAHVKKLLDSLSKYHPAFDNRNLTLEKLFPRVYPKQTFDYHKISNIISDLYQLAREFLKQKSYEKKEFTGEIWLLGELNDRQAGAIYEQSERKLARDMAKPRQINEDYYYLRYSLCRENTSYFNFKKPGGDFKLVQSEFDSFLEYSLTATLRLYMYMLHNLNHGNIKYNMELFDTLIEYIKQKNYPDNPLYMIYKHCIMLELYKEEKDYYILKELQKKYTGRISGDDEDNTFIFMNAFVVHMLNHSGDEKYKREKFEIFDNMIKAGSLTPDKIFYPDFNNVFSAAVAAGEYKWAENFSRDFEGGITPHSEKENALNYCRAFLAYRKKDFHHAIELFSKTNFTLFFIKIAVKSLTIRAYYEINMYEQGFAAIDSFRHYLRNEKMVSREQRDTHEGFLKCLAAMFKLKAAGTHSKHDLQELKNQVLEIKTNNYGVKVWLQKKLDEF